jgi:phage shock protein C
MNTPTSTPTGTDSAPRRLVRSKDDRMIAGVASGIAAYFDIDVTVVRISIAVLSVFGGAGVALYIAGWLLMPEAGSDESIATSLTRKLQQCVQS